MLEFTDDNFKDEVLDSGIPVLVDFWGPGCYPCRAIAPIMEAVAAKNEDIKVGKVNAAENPEVAAAYSISAIPTLLFFKNGEVVKKTVGFCTEQALNEHLSILRE